MLFLRFFVMVRATCIAILLVFAVSAYSYAQFQHPIALSANAVGDDNSSRIIIDFDTVAEVQPQLLEHPWRLVLDFDRVGFGFDPKPENWTGFTKDMRWGDMSDVNSRMIFEMDTPFQITKIAHVEHSQTDTHRLIIDLEKIDAEAFRLAMLDDMRTSAVVQQSSKSDRLGAAVSASDKNGRFVVVIDPGHGGIDSGAVSRKSVLEKEITLAFAKKLKSKLEVFKGVEVLLTRDTDVFVPLNDRVRFARQNGASLFLSIHADSVRQRNVRGATVYTISEKASDSVAAQIAKNENDADSVAGLSYKDEPADVSDILIDLARRETLGFSVQFARLAVDSIGSDIRMIKNPHRHAGFRVLRAPDVPSVLLELGFLSSPEDEKLLTSQKWRLKAADRVANAMQQFAVMSGYSMVARGVEK